MQCSSPTYALCALIKGFVFTTIKCFVLVELLQMLANQIFMMNRTVNISNLRNKLYIFMVSDREPFDLQFNFHLLVT